MFFAIDDIKKDVRVAMDENRECVNLIDDVDTLALDDIIVSKVEEAVNNVHLVAPVHLLDPGFTFAETIDISSSGVGTTVLPDDFLKLMVFKMNSWERAVFTAITPNDPVYALQSSRFKGVRGNSHKPVCVLEMLNNKLQLTFYSCNVGDTVEVALYQPRHKIKWDVKPHITICEKCYRSVVYKIAGLVMVSLGHMDRAEVFFNISNGLLK